MRSLLLLGTGGLCLAASLVHAEEILEEVLVTAERRAENIRDIPVAISAFSGEENSGRTNIRLRQQLRSEEIGSR